MSAPHFTEPTLRVSTLNKLGLRGLNLLLKYNLLGHLGALMMVIRVKGRKTGRAYSTPIAYMRDGDTIIAATNANAESNWYRNIFTYPQVQLTVQGKTYNARAEPIADEQERQRLFDLYKQERAGDWRVMFDAPLNSPEPELQQALAKRAFVRFYLNP